MRNVYILWASIRPEFVLKTSTKWISNCMHKDRLFFKIAMANENQKSEVEQFNIPNAEISFVDEKPGYSYAITKLTTTLNVNDEDILLLLSDDFTCLPAWDEFIERKFENWNGAVFLDDGYQNKNVKVGSLCITLACMTFACLNKINKVVFSPHYYHFFSDNEAFCNLNDLGLLRDDRDIDNFVFKHEHHAFGARAKDQFDDRAAMNFRKDHQTYNERMLLPVDERLKTIFG